MKEKGLTQSSLAREIWGTTKDARGYQVARNRDRISSYLAGIGMPEAENAKKIAEVLGCTIEDLMGPAGMARPLGRNRGTLTTQMIMSEDRPGWMQVQVNILMPVPKVTLLLELLEDIRREEEEIASAATGIVLNPPLEEEDEDNTGR